MTCGLQFSKVLGTFVFYMRQAPILLNKPAMMVLFHLLCIKCRLFQPCRIEYSAFSLILRSKLMIIMVGRCLSMLSAILLNIHHILLLAQFQRIFQSNLIQKFGLMRATHGVSWFYDLLNDNDLTIPLFVFSY